MSRTAVLDKVVGNVRIDAWQQAPGRKIHRAGDKLMAHLPGRKTRARVTFLAHVIPLRGEPHLEIVDHQGKRRCISIEAVTS